MNEPVLQLAIALLCIFSGASFRKHCDPNTVARWCTVLESIALRLLLPLLVFESFVQSDAPSHWKAAILIGFAVPLLIWIVAISFSKWPIRGNAWGEAAVLASTFGGGNRGVALLTIALSGSANLSPALRAFVLVDLGNLLCMLFVLPIFFARFFPEIGSIVESRRSAAWRAIQKILGSPAVGIFALVLLCVWAKQAQWPIEAGLLSTAGERKLLLTLCVFTSIGLKLDFKSFRVTMHERADGFSFWYRMVALRMSVMMMIGGLAWTTSFLGSASETKTSAFEQLSWPFVAAIVLLALPPSSLLPVLLQRTGIPAEQLQLLCTRVLAANLGYLLMLMGAGAIGTLVI